MTVHYDSLRELANDQALEIESLIRKIKSLEEEVSQLRQIINQQQETANTYGKIFQLQEAELKRLRGENNDRLYQQSRCD